jgi:hypothetical protein
VHFCGLASFSPAISELEPGHFVHELVELAVRHPAAYVPHSLRNLCFQRPILLFHGRLHPAELLVGRHISGTFSFVFSS